MEALIAVETSFFKTPSGEIWTTGQNDYNFWKLYLPFFDKLVVIARVKEVNNKENNWIKSSGERVEFINLPAYKGPWQYWRTRQTLKKIMEDAVKNTDLAILRVPGTIATLCWHELKKQGKKINLEVCGDPWESLAPGTIKSIVRPIARIIGTINLKKQCKEANAISYVTQYALQKRYPTKNKEALSMSISDVSLPEEAFCLNEKLTNNKTIRILNAGSMETLYKAQDVQIKAIKLLIDKGYNVRLDFAGDGKNRSYYQSLSEKLGIGDKIDFLGMLPGPEALRKEFLRSDLFLLPSFVEGLPRALIEAMAMGLPCIATNVGGIPELLPEEDLVKPRNIEELALKIMNVITDEKRMKKMSVRNFYKAQEYKYNVLNKRREKFLNYIKGTNIK